MHLLFDLIATQPLSGRFHGGAEYCKAVFRELIAAGPSPLSAFYDGRAKLDESMHACADDAGVELIGIDGKQAIEKLLASRRYDRFYSALPYAYHDLDFHSVEFVCTIHGLRPVELPTDSHEARYGKGLRAPLRRAVKAVFRNAYVAGRRAEFQRLLLTDTCRERAVVVPSEHTRYSLLRTVPGLDPQQVRVFYSPAKPALPRDSDAIVQRTLAQLGVQSRSFFLIVSGNRWVKNAIRAIEALDALFTNFPSVRQRVVVLGAQPDELRVRTRNSERFVFHDYVEPMALEALYASAFALVFPSMNEGFGYPPLEAMRYGTPVICSAVGPTTEICGDAALYINPWSPDEIATRALMLLLDDAAWERASSLGRARAELVATRQASDLRALADLLCAPQSLSTLQTEHADPRAHE